jgi:hypothetical protein
MVFFLFFLPTDRPLQTTTTTTTTTTIPVVIVPLAKRLGLSTLAKAH